MTVRFSSWLRMIGLAAVLAVPCVQAAPEATADLPAVSEVDIKAAMLVNFARFVEWPADGGGGRRLFTVAVYGRDPFGRVLDDLVKDKTIQGRQIQVIRPRELAELQGADVVYIPQTEEGRVLEILGVLRRATTLTVSDSRGFTGLGGMIGLVASGDRVRFQVNAGAAERVGLKVSSKLQRLASGGAVQP